MSLTLRRLKQLLIYNRNTGVFRWRCNRGLGKRGEIAGTIGRQGYRKITIDGRIYPAARLAWFWVTRELPPPNMVDHKNRVRDDDRFRNLRMATRRQQMWNRVLKDKNGLRNIRRLKDGRFNVMINYRGFDSLKDATAFRDAVLEYVRGEFYPY